MQSKSNRRISCHVFVDVINILVKRRRCRAHKAHALLVFSKGIHFSFVQQFVFHVKVQVLIRHEAVKVIDNVSSVHDFTKNVLEILPWNLAAGAVVHVVLKTRGRIPQVANTKRILHVVAHGAKLLSLHYYRVKVAQSKQDALCLGVSFFDVVLGEETPSTLQICLQPGRRFVCELYTSIQNADWNCIGWITCQEYTELFMAAFCCVFVELLLKFHEPLGHQVDII
mmetsp:Transcript_15447/g.26366  ORF Transcript_15447/g.26366 Transcript_15447/m.26366 type:complete len:226 (-) Transcript_15447:4678-5355(-)